MCISQGSPGNRTSRMCVRVERERDYEGLAHMIMEAKKSHDWPSAGWRPRKAGGIIQPEFEGLRTRGANGVNPSLRSGGDDMRCPGSINEAEKGGEFLLPLPFVLFQALSRMAKATHVGEVHLLSPSIQILVSSRNILIDTPRNNV